MNRNGFTLVELLAVIFILGIVIVIAYPVYIGISNSVKESNLETTKVMISNTMIDYANKYLVDDIKPSGKDCSSNDCCKYYSINYILYNDIFKVSNEDDGVINPVTGGKLEGYIKLSYNMNKYELEAEYKNSSGSECGTNGVIE